MTDLSPVAQAVLDAADNQPFEKPDGDLNLEGAIAAALRAAADQVMAPYPHPEDFNEFENGFLLAHIRYHAGILAIADELDPPSS